LVVSNRFISPQRYTLLLSFATRQSRPIPARGSNRPQPAKICG